MTQTRRENEKREGEKASTNICPHPESVSEMSVHIQESVHIRNVCPHLMSTRIQSLSISDSVRRSSSKCHRPISTSGPIASAHRPVVPDTTSSPDMFERQNADLVVANHQAWSSPPTMQNPMRRPSSPRPRHPVEPRHVRKKERRLGGRESPSLSLPSYHAEPNSASTPYLCINRPFAANCPRLSP